MFNILSPGNEAGLIYYLNYRPNYTGVRDNVLTAVPLHKHEQVATNMSLNENTNW